MKENVLTKISQINKDMGEKHGWIVFTSVGIILLKHVNILKKKNTFINIF